MLNKNFRRLAALALAVLLALCAGCGSGAELDTDAPAPTPEPSAPAPTPTPDAEQAPEPEAASSPTDVNAPAASLPELENPIERETPDSLQLFALGASFTLTNAESQTLTRGGSDVSGSMAFTQQQLSDAGGDMLSVVIPYSTRFTCEASGVSGDWGFEFLANACPWCHCVVKGSGKLEGFEYETGKGLTVRTEPGAELELTLPMAGNSLGESGWIRLRLTAGESEVSLAAEADGGGFSYSGVDTNAPTLLDCGGFHSLDGFDLAPESSSETIEFGKMAGFTAS